MRSYILFSGLVIATIVGFAFSYHKINTIEQRLLRIESVDITKECLSAPSIIVSSTSPSVIASSTSPSANKIMAELCELERLKSYISTLKVSPVFLKIFSEKVEFEIDLQERFYFRELGKDVYKNTVTQ